MIALFSLHFRHLIRGRLLFLVLLSAFMVHWGGLTLVDKFSIHLEWVELVLGISFKNAPLLFSSLYLQLFMGMFLAASYGIWIVPYLHRGSQGELTACLPVARWKYSILYGSTMLFLLALLHAIMLFCYGSKVGFHNLQSNFSNLEVIKISIVLQSMAFFVIMFSFAVCSLALGQIITFFVGVGFILLLQVGAILVHLQLMGHEAKGGIVGFGYRLYQSLPPLGELAFDLWQQFTSPHWSDIAWRSWLVWLGVFVALLTYKIRWPSFRRFTED
jgi:hypothetical protein